MDAIGPLSHRPSASPCTLSTHLLPLPPASNPLPRVARFGGSGPCSRPGNAGFRNWRRIIPTFPCSPGCTPTWWKTRFFCSLEQASSCERACAQAAVWDLGLWVSVCFSLQDRDLLLQPGGGRPEEGHRIAAGAHRGGQRHSAEKPVFVDQFVWFPCRIQDKHQK